MAGDPVPGGRNGPWEERLAAVVEMMREVSREVDPQAMALSYYARVRQFIPSDRFVALSRRDLPRPQYRISRSSTWKDVIDPWKERDRLPLLEGGLLGELLYGDV